MDGTDHSSLSGKYRTMMAWSIHLLLIVLFNCHPPGSLALVSPLPSEASVLREVSKSASNTYSDDTPKPIESCLPSSTFQNSEEVFQLLEKYQIRQPWRRRQPRLPKDETQTFRYILRQLSHRNKAEDAKDVLLFMLQQDEAYDVDVECLNAVLQATNRPWDFLREWNRWQANGALLPPANLVSYNIALSKAGPELGPLIYQDLLAQEKLEPDIVTYVSLLRSIAHDGDFETTRKWVEELEDQSNVALTPDCYEQVLYACRNDPKEAIQYLDSWRERAESSSTIPPPVTQSYNIVLHSLGLFQSEDSMSTEDFLQSIPIRDSVSYSTWIASACRNRQQLDSVERLVNQAHQEGLVNAPFLVTIFFALAQAGEPRLAETILSSSIARGVPITVEVYNALIHAWGKSGEADAPARVSDILTELEKSSQLKPDIKTYVSVLDCLSRSPDRQSIKDAEALLSRLETRRIANVQAYTSMIQNYAKSRSPYKASQAFRILGRMKKRRVFPNIVTYNAVLNAVEHTDPSDTGIREEALRIALEVWEAIRQGGMSPSHVTYGAFLGCLKLHPADATRDEMAKLVLRRSASEGQVSALVLSKLEAVVPQVYETLVPPQIPAPWTCRVRHSKARDLR